MFDVMIPTPTNSHLWTDTKHNHGATIGFGTVEFATRDAWVDKKGIVPLKLFRACSRYIHHEFFSFMMSPLVMSFGDRFCFSRKGRIGEVEVCVVLTSLRKLQPQPPGFRC